MLIVMPLVALMKQQRSTLVGLGFNASYIDSKDKVEQVLGDESITHIFLSPETLQTHCISCLSELSPGQKQRFSHIFVDESHCIVKW